MISVTKERSVLKFIKDDLNYATYDLKDGATTKTTNGTTRTVVNLKTFFRGYALSSLRWEDEKYKLFVNKIANKNFLCSNVGTFLERLKVVAHYEQYSLLGINHDSYIRHPLSIYSRDIQKIFIKYNIRVTSYVEKIFTDESKASKKDLYIKSARFMDENNFEHEDIVNTLNLLTHGRSMYEILCLEYGCDYKRVLTYIYKNIVPNEGMHYYDAFRILRDYISMQKSMAGNRKFDKYPYYLHTMHDIVSRNFSSFKQKYSEELFQNMVDKDLEYEYSKYTILTPKSTECIKQEGVSLKHCVGSYINRILKGETQIVFLRLKETPDESLVTVQITHGAIVQARGSMNRGLTKEEKDFLQTYANVKKLKINTYY